MHATESSEVVRTVVVWELKQEHIFLNSTKKANKDCLSEILMVIAHNTAARGHVITLIGSSFDQRMEDKSTMRMLTLGAGRYDA